MRWDATEWKLSRGIDAPGRGLLSG